MLKNKVDFKKWKIQSKNHVIFIYLDIWTSIAKGPHKLLNFAAYYNMIIPIETKDLPPEGAKRVKLDIKAYNMLDMALSP